MEKVGAYKVLSIPELNVEYYSGEITVDDLKQLKNEISKESGYDFNNNTLLDFRDATLILDIQDLMDLLDWLVKKFKQTKRRYVAYLTSEPNEVAQSILWSNIVEKQKDVDYAPGVFSTIEAVADYFNRSEINPELITSVLVDLKTNPNNVLPLTGQPDQ